jgi:hypothetical protein
MIGIRRNYQSVMDEVVIYAEVTLLTTTLLKMGRSRRRQLSVHSRVANSIGRQVWLLFTYPDRWFIYANENQ